MATDLPVRSGHTTVYRPAALCALAVALAACGSEPAPAAPAEEETNAVDISQTKPSVVQPTASESAPDKAPAEQVRKMAAASAKDIVPARFQGTYGENASACAQRNHGNFTVLPDRIDFFESNGEVQKVRVDGDYAALTVIENYADRLSEYVFYMALEGEDGLRFRYNDNERQSWVRCP